MKMSNMTVADSKLEKLVGIKVDQQLSFKENVQLSCKKANQKVNALHE